MVFRHFAFRQAYFGTFRQAQRPFNTMHQPGGLLWFLCVPRECRGLFAANIIMEVLTRLGDDVKFHNPLTPFIKGELLALRLGARKNGLVTRLESVFREPCSVIRNPPAPTSIRRFRDL